MILIPNVKGFLVGPNMKYEKVIVIKEENLANLESRLIELLKYEECKMVNFGIFSKQRKELVRSVFEKCALKCLKKAVTFSNMFDLFLTKKFCGR